jgi:TolA protein
MLRRDLDLMSLCTALKTWLSESADYNHIGLEERRHPLNQGRDDMVKTKAVARTDNKEKTPAKGEGDSWVKVEEKAARAKAEEEARVRAEQEAQVKAEQEARAKAEDEARARAEQEAQVKAEREARVRAEQEAQVKAEQKARAKAEEEARARAEQEARVRAEQEARVRAEQEAQVRAAKEDLARAQQEARVDSESEIANFQGIGKEQLKSATTSPTFLATGFQAITAETIEYSKKSLENGSAFIEKLLGAKSFQSAIHVRSEYAKTSYAALVAYLTKIGELNTKLAKEAFKRRSHVA